MPHMIKYDMSHNLYGKAILTFAGKPGAKIKVFNIGIGNAVFWNSILILLEQHIICNMLPNHHIDHLFYTLLIIALLMLICIPDLDFWSKKFWMFNPA